MSRKIGPIAGLLVSLSMLLTACTPQTRTLVTIVAGTPIPTVAPREVVITATPFPPAKPKILRVNLGTYPDIIDPQKSSFTNEISHLRLIYEGLTRLDDKLETVPGSAEKWEYNQDGTELTFYLRKGLKYSDGSLLNARRFYYSIKRNIDPHTAGEYAAITDEIKGAPPQRGWRGADLTKIKPEELAKLEAAVDASIQALDASGKPCKTGAEGYQQEDCLTLKLVFSRPAPYFHTVMGTWVAFPAKEENIVAGEDTWWTKPKYQVGNGPFVLKNLDPSGRSRFEPNSNYWGGKASVAVEYSYITDSTVAFQAYKNNELDVVALAVNALETVKNDPKMSKEAMIYPGSCTLAIMFHQQKEPFTDINVRKAFAMAFDRKSWVKTILLGLGSPTLTWIPKGYPGYKEGETRWDYNPAEAKKALAASKYGSVDKLPPIILTISDTPSNRIRNEYLAKKWKEVLGVDIKLNPVEPTTFTALTKDIKTAPQIYTLGWCADYPDPQDWLSVYWKTGGLGQRIGYSNKELDKVLDRADAIVDAKARMDLYQKAQDMLIDDVPAVFAWNSVNSYLVKPWVKGVKVTPQDSAFPGIYAPLDLDIDTALAP